MSSITAECTETLSLEELSNLFTPTQLWTGFIGLGIQCAHHWGSHMYYIIHIVQLMTRHSRPTGVGEFTTLQYWDLSINWRPWMMLTHAVWLSAHTSLGSFEPTLCRFHSFSVCTQLYWRAPLSHLAKMGTSKNGFKIKILKNPKKYIGVQPWWSAVPLYSLFGPFLRPVASGQNVPYLAFLSIFAKMGTPKNGLKIKISKNKKKVYRS